jgi:hypothetical protein
LQLRIIDAIPPFPKETQQSTAISLHLLQLQNHRGTPCNNIFFVSFVTTPAVMELRSFHPFPRLPKELRDMIWALAIRPKQPSAHWFTVFDTSNDVEWSVVSEYALIHGRFPRCVLAAPQRRTSGVKKQQFSWAKDSRSAYMTDSGQWMACK